ncbi:hypothetical protein D3880_11470 [Pseudomonas cavernae]|uniref:RapA2 cadherin-like domain-containing protein n=1 Tax=Pseudomonas cavernae TaxID=2320867 RepID=A0A385Z4E5_9PSED|nr:Ig-like domain-containing protein [Pseudomonas cavernae]AYC32957.1 hypothetical protein D3880_11470 [Pseudomonas cavernae]
MYKWPGILAIALGLGVGSAGTAQAQLAAVDPGPYTVATGGYPLWYQDLPDGATSPDSLKLELCLSKTLSSRAPGSYMCTLLPNPGVFDDTLPIAFPANFPDESFWMLAETTIADPGNGISLDVYVAGVEAAFAGGNPLPGDQQSFARIRIRASVPVAGHYKVIHPYGVDEFDVTTPGGRAINMTRDIGIGAPGIFTGALAGNIGPFLRHADIAGNPLPFYQEPNPETGVLESFVGDPNLSEPVTGSPFGTNFVRIEGPNGRVAQTNVFSLSGKLLSSQVGTKLEVDRASYSRDAERTWISVFGTSDVGASLCFRETLDLAGDPPSPCQFEMTADGVGKFFGQDIAPTSLPPFVIVSATNDSASTAPSSQTKTLTDIVNISTARYSWDSKTLTIEAKSSDEVEIPVLAAEGFGQLSQVGGTTQRLIAGDVAQPPAKVTVKSAKGGTDSEMVTVVGSPPPVPANLPPVAQGDLASTTAGVPVTLNVLANDSDPDGNLPLTLDLANLTQPAAGTGSVAANGTTSLIYTPPLASEVTAPLTATFTYQTKDALGGLSAPATVTVAVAPNQAPIAVNDTGNTTAGVPLTLDVLVNDSDPDGNVPLAVDAASLSAIPAAQGSLSTDGSTVTYTPPATVATTFSVSFTYRALDTVGGLSTPPATVTVTVAPSPVIADTVTITTATLRAKTNSRFEWQVSGTTSRPAGNTMRIEVTTTNGLALLGNAVPAANGRWSLKVNNNGAIVPSATPSARVTSTFGTVRTAPVTNR